MRLYISTTVVALALVQAPSFARAEGGWLFAGITARERTDEDLLRALEVNVRRRLLDDDVRFSAPAARTGLVTEAQASAAVAEIEALSRSARAAFDELDYDRCIATLEKAHKQFDLSAAYWFASTEMANALLLLAQAYEKNGQKTRARATYATIAARWPEHRADPNVFPPPVVEALDRARQDARTANVEVRAGSGRVFVDGVSHGRSPARVALAHGVHFVRTEGAGGALATKSITVDAKTKRIELEPDANDAALTRLLDEIAHGKGETAMRRSAQALLKSSGAETVLAGLVRAGAGGRAERLVLARFDAPSGELVRGAVIDLDDDGALSHGSGEALRLLAAREGDPDVTDAQLAAALEGARGDLDASGRRVPIRPKAGTAVPDEGGGRPGVRIVLLSALAIPVVLGGLLVVTAGVGGVVGTAAYVYFNPPNPQGTNITVDGRKLRSLR